MSKKQLLTLLVVILLAGLLMGAAASGTVWLRANQTVTVVCQGDELIVTPYGDNEAEITCRVWVER